MAHGRSSGRSNASSRTRWPSGSWTADFADGDTVLVDAHDGELVFEKAPAGEPVAV